MFQAAWSLYIVLLHMSRESLLYIRVVV